jgi:GWxTD domain-containing protein
MLNTGNFFSYLNTRYSVLFLFISTLVFISACSNKYVDDVDRSGGYEFRPGFPEVRLVTAGEVDQYTDSTRISVTAEVVYASLVFKKAGDVFQSEILLDVQILNETDPTDVLEVNSYPITISEKTQRATLSQQEYLFEEKFTVKPGDYKINVTVTDKYTNKQTVRSSETTIPNPSDPISHVTNIQVFAKDASYSTEFEPVTTYDISNQTDSIRFVFQVTNNDPEEPIVIDTRLLKFRADTSIARPMSWPNYNSSHIAYRGIYYDRYDVENSSRRIVNQPGSVTIEFIFPGLKRGNYRFEVTSKSKKENELYKARDFSVKSLNYPALKTPEELAAPLYYLMDKGDYEDMMAIEDNVELKKSIDRFWLSNIKNTRLAQTVISLYYERVEEANKQFSNFKEGWKTDMGMVYILFGPPWYVHSSLDETMWSYSYNFNDFEKNFYFKTPRIRNKHYPFDNYLLLRTQQYHNVQYQQIQLWLTGSILRDNL